MGWGSIPSGWALAARNASAWSGRFSIMVSRTKFRRANAPLQVYEISSAPAPPPWTLVKLQAADDNGVLYRVTRALAALGLNIAHAQINTFEKSVDDVFFVTGAQRPLDEAATEAALVQLKAVLHDDSLLTGKEST